MWGFSENAKVQEAKFQKLLESCVLPFVFELRHAKRHPNLLGA